MRSRSVAHALATGVPVRSHDVLGWRAAGGAHTFPLPSLSIASRRRCAMLFQCESKVASSHANTQPLNATAACCYSLLLKFVSILMLSIL